MRTLDIKATGTMTVDYVEKRIKKLCDRAGTTEELCAVIFDDISRVDAGALLGNLIYAMEFRNESVPLSDGSTLCIPDNVIIILTECRNFHAGHLDYALRRRMDYVAELKSDRDVLEKYYDTVNANAGRIIIDIFDSIKDFITTNAAPGIPDVADKYMFGHGMFMVERTGTAYFVLDKFKQKMMYQIFPFINNLSSLGILRGNIEVYEKALESKLNTGISSLNRISDIRKVMVNSGERVEPYSLEDTISYYETESIANRSISRYQPMVIKLVVFDKGDCRFRGLFSRTHIDGCTRTIIVHIFDLCIGCCPSHLLFDHDLRTKPHHQSDNDTKPHLADNLKTAIQSLFIFAKNFDVIIQEADQAKPHGRDDHQQHIDVGQISEQQDRNQDRSQNNDTTHGRGSTFLELSFQPQVTNLLTNLVALQHPDDPFTEDHPDDQCENNAHRSPKRQRKEHAHAGNIEM